MQNDLDTKNRSLSTCRKKLNMFLLNARSLGLGKILDGLCLGLISVSGFKVSFTSLYIPVSSTNNTAERCENGMERAENRVIGSGT